MGPNVGNDTPLLVEMIRQNLTGNRGATTRAGFVFILMESILVFYSIRGKILRI
jgi:hypothetical protein